jgi:hypothetical protein
MNLADTSSMLHHLTDLLAAGHEVMFAPTYGGHVEVHIKKLADEPGPDSWTAIEDTPELALWTASPLHGDEPLSACARCGHLHGVGHCREDGCGCPAWRSAPGWAMDAPDAEELTERVKALEENVRQLTDEFRNRLDALEERAEEIAPNPVIDSHLWYCAKCGGQCIGTEPANSVCRGCGGQA